MINLNEALYNIIFECYSKKGNESDILKVYLDMKENGITPGVVAYGLLIKLNCNSGNFNKAFEIFEECIKNNIKPNIILYQLLIKSQIKAGFIDRANTLFRNMSLQDVKADSKIYELVINACLNNTREPEAFEFTVKSILEKIILPRKMVTEVVQRYLKTNVLKFYEKKDGVRDLYYILEDLHMLNEVDPIVIDMINNYLYNRNFDINKMNFNDSNLIINPAESKNSQSFNYIIVENPNEDQKKK